MRIIRQGTCLEIRNHDDDNEEYKSLSHHIHRQKHGVLFPQSIRSIICGPSGSGKTNILLSLLFDPNGVKFTNVYIYCKSLYQPKYKLLQEVLERVKGIGYYQYEDNEQVINPKDAKSNSVMIFDDVTCDKQDNIRRYFSMGRHKNIDCFYLCQTYTRIPKHLIRDNANLLVLLKQDERNLKHVYEDHVGTDMTFQEFKNVCTICWKAKYGFLVIDKDSDLNSGRYRKGFDQYIIQ